MASNAEMNCETVCQHATVSASVDDGCIHCLKRHMDCGKPIDGMNNLGWRPLHVAAYKNHLKCLLLLIERSSDVDWKSFEDQTPLMLAAREGHYEICDALTKSGADVNLVDILEQNALMYAIRSGKFYCAKLLCERGTDLTAVDSRSLTLLSIAVELKNAEMVEMLLNQGADPLQVSGYGLNVLLLALMLEDNVRFVNTLLELVENRLNTADLKKLVNHCSGRSNLRLNLQLENPLSYAAKMDSPIILERLLLLGADPNVKVKRSSLAIFRSLEGCIDNFKLLLPPVTDLACLSNAFDDSSNCLDQTLSSATWRHRVGILVATALSDMDPRCTIEKGQRLRLLLGAGLDSIVNQRNMVLYEGPRRPPSYARLMNWHQLAGAPRSLRQMFGDFMTPLTQMMMEEVDRENIELMLEYGASWKPEYSTLEFSTVPFHFFMKSDMIDLVVKHGFDLNIYHPDYSFNLTILLFFCSALELRSLAKAGAETEHCFYPRSDVSGDAWSFQQFLYWFKSVKHLRPANEMEDTYIKLSQCVDSKRMFDSISVLLEFCSLPLRDDVCEWVCELVDDPQHKEKLVSVMTSVSELKHLARLVVRKALGPSLNRGASVMHVCGLWKDLYEYLLFE